MMRAIRNLLVLLCAAGLVACAGPRPLVTRQELRPPAGPTEPYTLLVTVVNQGGEGQAEIVARLRLKGSGETAAQEHQLVSLEPHETLQTVLELRPGAAGEYDVVVTVQYPPE